jgi:hypothetical protein
MRSAFVAILVFAIVFSSCPPSVSVALLMIAPLVVFLDWLEQALRRRRDLKVYGGAGAKEMSRRRRYWYRLGTRPSSIWSTNCMYPVIVFMAVNNLVILGFALHAEVLPFAKLTKPIEHAVTAPSLSTSACICSTECCRTGEATRSSSVSPTVARWCCC